MANQSQFRRKYPDFNDGIVPQHLDLSSWTDSQAASLKNRPIVERLTVLITLIVAIVGLVGNFVTMIVLNHQTMRKWRSSILLTALAFVDFLYLLIIFLTIIDQLTFQSIGFHRSLPLCQVSIYITHVCSFLSASFTLSFTAQRFVAVCFPLESRLLLAREASFIHIFVWTILGLFFYSFSFFYSKLRRGQCIEDENEPFLNVLLIIDSCLTFVIPFAFILLFNISIVNRLRRRTIPGFDMSTPRTREKQSNFERRRHLHRDSQGTIDLTAKQLAKKSKFSSGFGVSHDLHLSRSSLASNTINLNVTQQQIISRRTTKMLVICSTMFLVFNSPYSAVLLWSIVTRDPMEFLLNIFRHFYFLSFASNFFLYSLCGHRFRHEFLFLFKRAFRKSWIHHRFNTISRTVLHRTTLKTIDEITLDAHV